MGKPLQPVNPLTFWSFEFLGTRPAAEIEEIMMSLFARGIYPAPGLTFDAACDAIGEDPVLLLFRDGAGEPWTGIASVEAVGVASRRRGIDALDGVVSIYTPGWPESLWPADEERPL